jgi:hypothetical protein
MIFHQVERTFSGNKSDLAGSTVRLEIRLACERHNKEDEVSGVAIILVVLERSFLVQQHDATRRDKVSSIGGLGYA